MKFEGFLGPMPLYSDETFQTHTFVDLTAMRPQTVIMNRHDLEQIWKVLNIASPTLAEKVRKALSDKEVEK